MPRHVLIVSPNFPPKSTPDLHRVRTSLPYYRTFGWEATVLAVTAESCEGINDPLLAETLPNNADVVRVAAWDRAFCRRLGFNLLEYRALWPLYRAGNKILRERKYDVVFFSTTAFLTFLLGPIWRKRFGVKIVYDIQDPWYHGNNNPYDPSNAPGGWRRYRLAQAIAKCGERFAMRGADRIISVSEGYVNELTRRYRFLAGDMFDVIPFGTAFRDYEIAARHLESARSQERQGVRWVSVGRAGADMEAIMSAFFAQLAALKAKAPEFASKLRVDFIGTNYAPASRSRKLVLPIASRFGLDDIVHEQSERVAYFEALAAYIDSDAILLFGSDQPSYVASKLFNCIGARRPILAMFRKESFVARVSKNFPNMRLAAFSTTPNEADFSAEIQKGLTWLESAQFAADAIDRTLEPWSAETLSAMQCQVFEKASAA